MSYKNCYRLIYIIYVSVPKGQLLLVQWSYEYQTPSPQGSIIKVDPRGNHVKPASDTPLPHPESKYMYDESLPLKRWIHDLADSGAGSWRSRLIVSRQNSPPYWWQTGSQRFLRLVSDCAVLYNYLQFSFVCRVVSKIYYQNIRLVCIDTLQVL